MKHCILVKFIPEISKKVENNFLEQIQEIFNGALEIEGIHYVHIHKNCTNRDNRADIMIELDMDKDVLEDWEKSDAHLIWKTEFGRFIDTKTIFDY